MDRRQVLAEVEDVIRTMPPRATLRHDEPENFAWLGRVAAVIALWNPSQSMPVGMALHKFHERDARTANIGWREIMTLLNQARADLRMQTTGPVSAAIPSGLVFDYFDEVRKIVELAKDDVLFVDPYLDAAFVSRYLPHVSAGVSIRLLTGDKKLASLLPAVDVFSHQHAVKIAVRSASGLHDRHVLIDKRECYQSGASFKDGGRFAPTTLTQITDAFAAVLKTYENAWSAAKVER